ncbi:CIA30 family protein [Ferrimonas balearica]|uniref:CIA30 family protein n=1 Tax=Ferrimonas balearica TaxID=44012 RepID=UPI001F164DDE|nr:CIA30 family protein [Ferrimonas balearica]MBY6096661.1 CIA30 family protein [Ferrimonas balearica]
MWQLDLQEVAPWLAVNDGVMGGISQARYRRIEEGARFEGEVSLAYGGGFASIRRPVRLPLKVVALSLRVRGDGQRYQLRLRTHGGFDGVVYAAGFDTVAGQWQTLSFTLDDFQATYRGRPVASAPALRWQDVQQLGLLIADKQAGPFTLDLASLTALQE